MAEFKFHCQEKMTIWFDTTFTIKAESKEDAIKFLKENSMFNADELGCQFPEKVNVGHGQYIDDCAEPMGPDENGGQSTIEYTEYDGGPVICANVNE